MLQELREEKRGKRREESSDKIRDETRGCSRRGEESMLEERRGTRK